MASKKSNWIRTPKGIDLRASYPELATSLDSLYATSNLDRLGLVYKKSRSAKKKSIHLELEDGYQLRISPVDRGILGHYEYYTFTYNDRDEIREDLSLPKMYVRSYVELLYGYGIFQCNVTAFTIEHDSWFGLIKRSLAILKTETFLDLHPVIR